MTSNRRQSSSFLALTFGGWAALASAQTTADTLTGGAGTPANTAPSTLTGAAGTPSVVLEQEARDANDGLFRILNPNFSKPLGVAGGTGEVRGSLPLAPQFGVSLLEWQARPEDAQIQLGNLYLQFRALSAQLLVSDNVDQTEINRRAGAVSIVRLELMTYVQILENLRVAFGGSVVWLPFRNEIGFDDPLAGLNFDASISPVALFQLAYQVPAGHWDVNLFDQFSIQKSIGLGSRFDLLNRGSATLEDRQGRLGYTFQQSPQPANSTLNTRRFAEGVEYHNNVGFNATRMLPTTTRLNLGFAHDDTFYSRNPFGLPSSQNTATASLASERESLRFKPFATYSAHNQSNADGWDHEVRGGVTGPITDFVDFLGDAGYYTTVAGQSGSLWRVRLAHNPRESTHHSIEYRRSLTYPIRDVATTIEYRLDQAIGPELLFELGLQKSTFESLDNPNTGTVEKRAEGRLTWTMNPRALLRAGVAYSDVDSLAPGAVDYRLLTGRLGYEHRTFGNMSAVILYQHERRISSLPLDSYYENLVSVTLRKEF